jgi:hypothetical protein
MDKKLSQQNNFGLDAIPILFHSTPTKFVELLEKDGMKFLTFWWNHVGDRLPEDKRVSPAGMTFDIEQLDKKTKLIIISLPTPKADQDPIFLGFVAKPERRLLWVRMPTSLGFALIRDDGVNEQNRTSFGFLTPNGHFRPRGIGLKPTKLDFKKQIIARLAAGKKAKRK